MSTGYHSRRALMTFSGPALQRRTYRTMRDAFPGDTALDVSGDRGDALVAWVMAIGAAVITMLLLSGVIQ